MSILSLIIAKILGWIGRLYGGGSALPGLVLEKLAPNLLTNWLKQLPKGVVVISGTNGKTSTTKFLTQILRDQGLRVFTNSTGSNFLRGVGSAFVKQTRWLKPPVADIAVLELDEAHAKHFVKTVPPTYSILLNVFEDQVDRFADLDHVANLLQTIANATTKTVIINGLDSRLSAKNFTKTKTVYFGASNQFAADLKLPLDPKTKPPTFELKLTQNQGKQFTLIDKNGSQTQFEASFGGIHNHFNLTAAILASQAILKTKLKRTQLKQSVAELNLADGRGQTFKINHQTIDLTLVKNTTGFDLALDNLQDQKAPVLLIFNDAHADGRNLSWLWDVNFSKLEKDQVKLISGSRCFELALCLRYRNFPIIPCEENPALALEKFLRQNPDSPSLKIFASYTATAKVHPKLTKLARKSARRNHHE